MLIWAAGTSLSVFVPWACLSYGSRERFFKVIGLFKYLWIAVIAMLIISGAIYEKGPFPLWGIIIFGIGGIAVFTVMIYLAIKNFHKWLSDTTNEKETVEQASFSAAYAPDDGDE